MIFSPVFVVGVLASSRSASGFVIPTSVTTRTQAYSSLPNFSSGVGESALSSVQSLASRVAAPPENVAGTGGAVMRPLMRPMTNRQSRRSDEQVWAALENLERDMQFLDRMAGEKPQLSPLELALLSLCVAAAGSGPLVLNMNLAEFIAPSAAAFAAAIGIGAEYVGKVAVADGKEIAAATIQCAAESEGLLANAERAKAVIPLCVGVSASAATFALLVPVLLESLSLRNNLQLVTEIYLLCPLAGILAAAVAALALQETRGFCSRAMSVGIRRFAKSGMVGRTWLSSAEQVERKSQGISLKWRNFGLSVVPAPLVGCLVPGALPTKTIIVTALAAAQSAYFLAQAEYSLSRAQDSVALKARSAAVCDTYANQGARSAAILPFTSALSSLCAAATAAIVELPFLHALGAVGGSGVLAQSATIATFPTFSALFAAAASVSKARCEVDAEAASQAASTLALEYEGNGDDPVLQPFRGVWELIKLTTQASIFEPIKRFLGLLWLSGAYGRLKRFFNGLSDSSGLSATKL